MKSRPRHTSEENSSKLSIPQRRLLAFKLVTISVVTIICLAIAELILRQIGTTPYLEPDTVVGMKHPSTPSDYLPSTIAPYLVVNHRGKFFNVTYKANNEGFRDNELLALDKPDNVYRVLLLGDSFTFGHGVNFSQTYGEYAERSIQGLSDKKFRMINGGYRSGYTIDHYFAFLRREGEHYSPDHVVIQIYTGNDFSEMEDNIWEEVDEQELPVRISTRRNYTDYRGYFLEPKDYDPHLFKPLQSSALAVSIARRIGRRKTPKRQPREVIAQRYERMLKAISDYCRKRNLPLTWIIIPPRPKLYTSEHHFTYELSLNSLRDMGSHVDIIDFHHHPTTPMIKQGRRSLYIRGDAHLTPTGNRILGKMLGERILDKSGRLSTL